MQRTICNTPPARANIPPARANPPGAREIPRRARNPPRARAHTRTREAKKSGVSDDSPRHLKPEPLGNANQTNVLTGTFQAHRGGSNAAKIEENGARVADLRLPKGYALFPHLTNRDLDPQSAQNTAKPAKINSNLYSLSDPRFTWI